MQSNGELPELAEQPMPAGFKNAFKQVSEKTTLALMADESLHSSKDAEKLISEGGVKYFNIKLMKCGGLFEAIKIYELAKKHEISCQIGSMIESMHGSRMGFILYQMFPDILTTDLHAFSVLNESFDDVLKLEGDMWI